MHKEKVFVVSSCGTSLLTHGASPEEQALLRKTANLREVEYDDADREAIRRRIETVRERLLGKGTFSAGKRGADDPEVADVVTARRLSAELNGLAGFYEGNFSGRARDHHVLLHSDTFQGEAAAAMVRDWLTAQGLNCSLTCIEGLNTRRFENFREGLCSLVTWCTETVPGYREAGYGIVFNLVGGFKSLQGFLQTLGMLHADTCLYVFESEDAPLLQIPRLPLDLDAGIRKAMETHFALLRRLDVRGTLSARDCAVLPETLLYCLGGESGEDGECELSPWGRMLWEKYKRERYDRELLDPPSDLVRFGPKFAETVKGLPKDRRYLVNLRIEDLARHLESERAGQRKAPLKRLDLKELKNNPLPPSTHECDAWSDRDAKRLYGHYDAREKQVFVLDRLDSALHA